MIPTDELQAFFRSIETGDVRLVAEADPQDVYAGNVVYRASNGWTLTVFNDCNEFDYVDKVQTDDNRILDFDDLWSTNLPGWEPDEALAWRCLGIPGYCSFRCTVCGASLPDAMERGKPVTPPFLCGEDRCIGQREPAVGTWIRVSRG